MSWCCQLKSQEVAKVVRIHPLGTTKQAFALLLYIVNCLFKIGASQSGSDSERKCTDHYSPLLSVLSTSRWWRMNFTFFPNKTGQFVSIHLPSASWFISGIRNWSARRVGPVQLAMEHYVYLVFFLFFCGSQCNKRQSNGWITLIKALFGME